MKPLPLPPAAPRRIESRPTGPWHDFWILREQHAHTWRDLIGRDDAPVRISDDVRGRLEPSLQWIATKSLANGADHRGLDVWGATLIRGRVAGARLRSVCRAWADLFAEAPRTIAFPMHVEREGRGRRRRTVVEELRVDRATLVRDLRLLARFGERVAKGRYAIVHIGV